MKDKYIVYKCFLYNLKKTNKKTACFFNICLNFVFLGNCPSLKKWIDQMSQEHRVVCSHQRLELSCWMGIRDYLALVL